MSSKQGLQTNLLHIPFLLKSSFSHTEEKHFLSSACIFTSAHGYQLTSLAFRLIQVQKEKKPYIC